MKTTDKILLGLAAPLASVIIAMAQGAATPSSPSGVFSTTMQWQAYAASNSITGFEFLFGTSPGQYSVTNVVTNSVATSFVATTLPGTTNYSVMRAFASDGRVSPWTAEVSWTNPPLLSAPVGYRPAAIVYVPAL